MKLNLKIKSVKTVLRHALLVLFLVSILALLIDRCFSWFTQHRIYTDPTQLPNYDVALVLGTSKYLGRILNDYYTNRIQAAIDLFQSNKVTTFLLSGDNAHRSYNEPWTMKRDLLQAGVPDSSIYLDYAGFRTLDSVVRAKEIFEADRLIIITQKFHCERALVIASHYDLNSVCLAVPGPSQHSGIIIRIREVLARVKAVLDLYLLRTRPKFLGPKEPIILLNDSDSDYYIPAEIEEQSHRQDSGY